jgi:small-conductance mechanosensitive channel
MAAELRPWRAVAQTDGVIVGSVLNAGAGLVRIVLIVVGAFLVGWLADLALRRFRRGHLGWFLDPLYNDCHELLRVAILLGALYLALEFDHHKWTRGLRHATLLALIVASAFLFVRGLHVVEDIAFGRFPEHSTRDRRLRRARTQIRLIRRLTAVVMILVAIAAMLTTFGPLRTLGFSLLTSAGVVGVVIGLSARTALANAFAGIQLAFADAMHVDDVIVVEGNWGRVEEIKLTNVIVRLWDDRRLVLPTSYFTEKTFQNWTRNETRVIGEVMLQLDYTVDLDILRGEAHRIVRESPLWDQNQWVLHMVDMNPQTVIIQVLASAADGPSAWDLRCEMREGLIKFCREQYPEWLPRTRNDPKP